VQLCGQCRHGRLFGLLKRERVNNQGKYRTRAEARADVFDDIERFQNPRRRRQLEAANGRIYS